MFGSRMIEGWAPDPESVSLLSEFAAGQIDIDEYNGRVIALANTRLPRLGPESFGDALPDTDIAAWERDSPI